MKKTVATAIAFLTLLMGAALILISGFAFLSDFNPLELERTERTVEAKRSELKQSLLPKYAVIVTDEFGIDVSIQRVSKRMLSSIQTGDTISGYEKNGVFFTGRQMLSEVTLLIGLTLGGCVLVLIGLSIVWREKTFMKKFRTRMRDFFMRMPSGTRDSWKYILLTVALIWLFGGNVLHFFHIHFTSHQETTAEVIEVERDPGYGRFNAPSYYFTFYYEKDGEPIIVETKVNKEIYDSYGEGSTVTLWHKTNNPYYAFSPGEVNVGLKQLIGGM